jgi:tRNA threonylcarbamoyladenosine biosynthesis protein TsaE
MSLDLTVTQDIALEDETATLSLGQALAEVLKPGDVICLTGDLGAGKSTLARALVRALTTPDEDVPSPTFTLMQTYDGHTKDGETIQIAHLDLYRLQDPEEAYEIGLFDLGPEALILIEWPEKLEHLAFDDHLQISLDKSGGDGRLARLTPVGKFGIRT